MQPNVRTRRLYKEIYVSVLSMFSAMSKCARPRMVVNELLVARVEANLQVNFFARVSTNGRSIHTTMWFAFCIAEVHVRIDLCLLKLQISIYIVLS